MARLPSTLVTAASVLVLAVSLLLPRLAAAEEPPPDEAPTESHWYGAPILAADAAAFGLVYVASQYDDDGNDVAQGVELLGLSALVANGAIGHGMNGHGGRAAESLALRLGLPLLGMALARSTCDAGPSEDCNDSGMSGAALGLFTAIVFDDLLLAVDDRPVEASPSRGLQLGLAPRGDGGFVASMGASF
jgi:hypothetical protein